jgi:hypothetical protein
LRKQLQPRSGAAVITPPIWRRPATGILLVALACALALALPGETVTTAYVNDLFIFLDGAHRIAAGQVPNRDFHTALGPLVFYIPAMGYWLAGHFGGALPVGMALLVLAMAPVLAHVLTSRLAGVIALPFGIFLLLILAMPKNLGEGIGSLSFAMFYNRVGWVALAALLVMHLPARGRRLGQLWLDGFCATFLTVILVYTKVTYGLVALAFLSFVLFDQRQRLWAASAIAGTVLTAIVVEFFWRSSSAHLADLMLTGRVSALRRPEDLALAFLRHLADYVLFGILVVFALWRSRRLRDMLFFGFCAGPGLLILNQNSQPWGIITLHAGAAVAAEVILRSLPPVEAGRRTLAAGAPLLLLALVLPTAIHSFLALGLHASLAVARAGEPFGLPAFDRVRLARQWSPADDPLTTAYLDSVRAGARALAALPMQPKQVSVLDFANPFSAGLNLPPPRGDSAWLHWGRNVSAEHFLPPEQLLGDVEVLMIPKWGINHIPLRELYQSYVADAFEPVVETESWILHLRRDRLEGETLAGSSRNLGDSPVLGLGSGTTP